MMSEDEVLRAMQARIDEGESWRETARRFGDDARLAIKKELAKILLEQAESLCHDGHEYVEIVAICDEITQRYAEDADLAMRMAVIDALHKKGKCLGTLGEAILNDLRSVGGDEREKAALLDAFQTLIAKSDANAAGEEEGREIEDEEIDEKARMTYQASFAVFEEIVRRFGDDSRHEIRLQVAKALWSKGAYSNNPADYDEVVRRYGKDPSPEMREKVNGALLCKARDLEGRLGHRKKAIAVYEQIMRRNEDDRKMTLVALVGKSQVLENLAMHGDHEDESGALWKRARKAVFHGIEAIVRKLWFEDFEWEMLGRMFAAGKAIAVNDEIIRRYGEDSSPNVRNEVARAFFRKGDVLARRYECLRLYDDDNFADAVTAYDELWRRYGEDADSREIVTEALLYKGALLKLLGRSEEARTAFDEFERRFDDRRQAAEAYCDKGYLLSALSSPLEEAVAVLDEVARRYGEDASPDIRKIVLDSLVKKAAALMEMVDHEKKRERLEEAIAVYDEIARRYGEDTNLDIRRVAARALFDKSEVFYDTFNLHYEADEALDDALAVLDEVARRYGGDTDAEIKGVAAKALILKCWALERRDRLDEAVAACDEVARRLGQDSDVALQKKVVEAMRAKGNVLGGDAEIAVFDEILRSCDESEEDENYRYAIAEVFYEKGVALSEQGRFQEALDVFEEYEQRFADTFNSNHRQQLAEAKENAARGKPCGSRMRLGTVDYE
ncbi:MAG: hypothetical protein LBU11_03315 [Zoogloeaceae bacterium]|jgi:tetratricopeptide (TPR) repeat protein|nr:hypothetical protein [Zoogloeaceae bacterium]